MVKVAHDGAPMENIFLLPQAVAEAAARFIY